MRIAAEEEIIPAHQPNGFHFPLRARLGETHEIGGMGRLQRLQIRIRDMIHGNGLRADIPMVDAVIA